MERQLEEVSFSDSDSLDCLDEKRCEGPQSEGFVDGLRIQTRAYGFSGEE